MDTDEGETTHYFLDCSGGMDEWHWNAKSTKLLVELYVERRNRFRDPKTRKRALWTEIVDDMERAGYKGINEDICDRKWRNMKKTYRTCRETLKKNGRKRAGWEYFDIFDEMFQNENIKSEPGNSKKDDQQQDRTPSVDTCASVKEENTQPETAENTFDISMGDEQQRQLLILERSRISAIRELSKRIEESNTIQRERNDLLREYLSQL